MDLKPVILVYVATAHDTNGNPRRGWVGFNAEGDQVAFEDEGYAGPMGTVSKRFPGVPTTPSRLAIPPSEYNRLKRWEAARVKQGMYSVYVECTHCTFVGTHEELEEHAVKHEG